MNSSAPFTLHGDRGGTAEDAELLAELKAISAGSSSRFASADASESDLQANPSQGAVVVTDKVGAKTTSAVSYPHRTVSANPQW